MMERSLFIFLCICTIAAIGTITYLVSVKPPDCQLTTPDIIGLDVNESKRFLESRGLSLFVKDTITSDSEKGKIISQSPSPGTLNCESVTVIINWCNN